MKLEKGQRKQSEVVKGSQTPLCKVFFLEFLETWKCQNSSKVREKGPNSGKGQRICLVRKI